MKRQILVIDDDDLVRKSIQGLLRIEGYESASARDAFEALERVKETDFDLIVSDIRMPGMNGVEAIKEIRRLFNEKVKKDIPIIFITGYADLSLELDAERFGEVILKPFDLNHLVTTIREYL